MPEQFFNQLPEPPDGLDVEINEDMMPEVLPENDTGSKVIRVHYISPDTGNDYFTDWDAGAMPDEERSYCRQHGIDIELPEDEPYISEATRRSGKGIAEEDIE